MPDVLWCWCCATWGLAVAAIDGAQALCARCLDATRAECKPRHIADALTAGQQAAVTSG